ncbi:MAG: DinB family protein [Vicinamibacterales bacterium]
MDATQSAHVARVRQLRESFAAANERLVARLRRASDEAAERRAPEAWSAAQIGWHVATVSTRFAAMIAGDVTGPQPLPESFQERPWDDIAASVPERLQAPRVAHPPTAVTRREAVAALEASGTKMASAFDALTQERAGGMGITHAVVGTINLYQLAAWATAHIARHNKQAKRILGEG